MILHFCPNLTLVKIKPSRRIQVLPGAVDHFSNNFSNSSWDLEWTRDPIKSSNYGVSLWVQPFTMTKEKITHFSCVCFQNTYLLRGSAFKRRNREHKQLLNYIARFLTWVYFKMHFRSWLAKCNQTFYWPITKLESLFLLILTLLFLSKVFKYQKVSKR